MTLTELQLDALRELANIGSGNASTSLAAMVGRPIHVSVPRALALPLADAVEAVGDAEDTVTGVALGVLGDLALLLDTDVCIAGESSSFTFLLLPAAGGVETLLARLGVAA